MMIRHSSTSFILLLQLLIFQSPLISQQILITEVMYYIDGTDSPNEFVEIFNPSVTFAILITIPSVETEGKGNKNPSLIVR